MTDQENEKSVFDDVFGEELPYESDPKKSETSQSETFSSTYWSINKRAPASSYSPTPAPSPLPTQTYSQPQSPNKIPISMYKKQNEFSFVGRPVYNIKWDDLGLGLMKPMGYAPNRAIRVEVKDGKWIITGARVPSSILLFLALGAGGAFHFLQNILMEIKNWGEIVGAVVVFLPTILNLLIRNHSLELYPFELDYSGYDPNTHVLVISTVTEPAGVVAMKIEFSSDDALAKIQETKLIENLRRSHTGFMLIQGDANIAEAPPIKQWSLWTLVWLVLVGVLTYWYIISNRMH